MDLPSVNFLSTGISTLISVGISSWTAYFFAERKAVKEHQRQDKKERDELDRKKKTVALQIASRFEVFTFECAKFAIGISSPGDDGGIARTSVPPLDNSTIDGSPLDADDHARILDFLREVNLEREQLNEHWDDVAADWEDMARAAAYILQAEGLRAMKLAKDLRDNYGVLKLNMSPSQNMLFSALVDID